MCLNIILSLVLSSCFQSSPNLNNSQSSKVIKSNNIIESLQDLRFSSPPGALDGRIFTGVEFSTISLRGLSDEDKVLISDENRYYLSAKVFELKSSKKISIIPSPINKKLIFKVNFYKNGTLSSSKLIRLKPGTYTKI